MPSRNVLREDAGSQYYHIYNRSIANEIIFKEEYDFRVFLNLLKRYLQEEISKNKINQVYENYSDNIELLAYCLMPTHYHLLMYQKHQGGIANLMKAISNAYTKYFNQKYSRRGPIFVGRYKASRIDSDEQLMQVSRYIHLNPTRDYKSYEWSSLGHYQSNKTPNWIKPQKVLALFSSKASYANFVSEYKTMHKYLEDLKYALADNGELLKNI
jgi:putative transposase